ncbi:hypothetical protein [Novosphingobium sp. NDB2Meth1]|uniref:hypothetical protein n=1 Tax=Novosphingobium sp. NDB2Meth1 TaxID=1892847 RepID=UPI000931BEA4|nr:hypothetical protein [Novosphingobium sp. NDB2Meth1]
MIAVTGRLRQLAVIGAAVLMLACNLGFDPAPTDLEAAGQRGMYAAYPVAFAPHPFTFAIWLPIFVGAIAFAFYQAWPTWRDDPQLDRIGRRAAAGYLLVGGTAFTPLGPSNLVVAAAFVCLAGALLAARPLSAGAGRWLVRAPLGLFAGWLLVATTLNACQLAQSLEVPTGPLAAAALMIGASLAAMVLARRSNEQAVLVAVIWALAGITAANPDAGIIWVAWGTSLLVITTLLRVERDHNPGRQAEREYGIWAKARKM